MSDEIHLKILQNAQQSGIINLTGRNLNEVPPVIWTLNSPLKPVESTVNLKNSEGESKWWETQDITKLLLPANKLTRLDGSGLSKLDTLVILDVRDNLLQELPLEIGKLNSLKLLNISYNRLQHLPPTVTQLQALTHLDTSHNELESLPDGLEDMRALDTLDISYNKLATFPLALPQRLTQLIARQNQLSVIPAGVIQRSRLLKLLDMSENRISDLGIDSGLESNPNVLTTLQLQQNCLEEIPELKVFSELKEVYLGKNRIYGLSVESLTGLHELMTLDLSHNRIDKVPASLPILTPKLTRLDISSNEIKHVPTELGFMDNLKVLVLNSNPLKSIRQEVVLRGSGAVKSLLRGRHLPAASTRDDMSSGPHEAASHSLLSEAKSEPSLPAVRSSGELDWSIDKIKTSLQTRLALNEETAWLQASHTTDLLPVLSLSLRGCKLPSFPLGILAFENTLTVLDLSKNLLPRLDENLYRLKHLVDFDVSFNRLEGLEASLRDLGKLQNLRLDFNPGLGPELPVQVIFQPPLCRSLQLLSARSCGLKGLPAASLLHRENMPHLQHLDVSDNNIDRLEPELGLCEQLRSLNVVGNALRIPRPDTIAKGTSAILSYLRSRITG